MTDQLGATVEDTTKPARSERAEPRAGRSTASKNGKRSAQRSGGGTAV